MSKTGNIIYGGVLLSEEPSKILVQGMAEMARINNIVRSRELFWGWLTVGFGLVAGFAIGSLFQSVQVAFVISFVISLFGTARIALAPSYYGV